MIQPLLLTATLWITASALTAKNYPLAYPNVTINGTTHPIVIVENHPEEFITYSIKGISTKVARDQAPKEILLLIENTNKQDPPLPAPIPLSTEDAEKVKENWKVWLEKIEKNKERGVKAIKLPEKTLPDEEAISTGDQTRPSELLPLPAQSDDSPPSTELSSPAKILIVVREKTNGGVLAERLEYSPTNPSLDILTYSLSPEIPPKELFFLADADGEKSQKKAVLITQDGFHSMGSTKVRRFKVIEEYAPPPEIFMPKSSVKSLKK